MAGKKRKNDPLASSFPMNGHASEYVTISSDDEEMYVNKKKLEQLSIWFESIVTSPGGKILLLIGPTGSGKTFSVLHLARKFKIRLFDYEAYHDERRPSEPRRKYGALDFHDGPIENEGFLFDNFNPSNHTAIVSTILPMKIPIILIVTEPVINEASSVSWLKSLGDAPRVTRIEFIPFPRTVLKKAVSSKFPFVVEEILDACSGDLRAAIMTHFLFLLEGSSNKVNPQVFMAESTLGLFHAMGKFLYPRKVDQVYDVHDFWSGDLGLFNWYLFHNFPQALDSVESTVKALDSFCESDRFSTKLTHYEHHLSEYLSLPSRSLSGIVTRAKAKRFVQMTKAFLPVKSQISWKKFI